MFFPGVFNELNINAISNYLVAIPGFELTA